MKPTKEDIENQEKSISNLCELGFTEDSLLIWQLRQFINRMKADLEPQYKVGDRVRVIGKTEYETFKIGEKVEIVAIDPDSPEPFHCVNAVGQDWEWITNDVIEPIPQERPNTTVSMKGGQFYHGDDAQEDTTEEAFKKAGYCSKEEYTADEMYPPSPQSSFDFGNQDSITTDPEGKIKEVRQSIPQGREQYHPSRMDYFVGQLLSNTEVMRLFFAKEGRMIWIVDEAKEAIKQIDNLNE